MNLDRGRESWTRRGLSQRRKRNRQETRRKEVKTGCTNSLVLCATLTAAQIGVTCLSGNQDDCQFSYGPGGAAKSPR